MRTIRLLFFFSGFAFTAFGQNAERSTVSLGAGLGIPAGGYLTGSFSTNVSLGASYEFRLSRYLAPEVGVASLLPRALNNSEYGISSSRENVTLLSLGIRGILPLADGKAELFAGPGVARLFSSSYELTGSYQAPSFLFELATGARVAVDRRHRYWFGPTVRFARNGGRPTEEWVSLTADFGIRF